MCFRKPNALGVGWVIQPDFRYIIHPGGGVIDQATSATGPNVAAACGLRSTIKF